MTCFGKTRRCTHLNATLLFIAISRTSNLSRKQARRLVQCTCVRKGIGSRHEQVVTERTRGTEFGLVRGQLLAKARPMHQVEYFLVATHFSLLISQESLKPEQRAPPPALGKMSRRQWTGRRECCDTRHLLGHFPVGNTGRKRKCRKKRTVPSRTHKSLLICCMNA
jgi:hypothetical protein